MAVQNNPDKKFEDNDNANKPSKTQRKQAMHKLQKMGEQLVELNDRQLEELNLQEMLLEAIFEARRINKFGARQRQMQYIGKLMRKIDILPIQEKLNTWQQIPFAQKVQLHQIERWRERLLNDANALTEFIKQYPTADIKQIRSLTRNTFKEKVSDKPPKSYRSLFQLIQETIQESN
ncbi:ribosome biogenesis factor YjgA [Nitrosomonas aestuarii]|uniref:ribosome biogenesis factor YjgA n=1 Tax=Nitrosomonas aestuarii TaxID=52441 RepID=UPI000D3020C7|nr:ribosome biogenesis factor YjgA [Nitrosomonas aestuarii]PTN11343.1 ribosome-associated protein [Nitrosomonas aestuarii]